MAGAAFSGCSRKEANLPEVEIPEGAKTAPTAPDPIIAAGLEDVSKKLSAQQYEAAVGGIAALSSMPKNDAQHDAYMNQLRQMDAMISKRISEGDQKALEAKRMMDMMIYRR
jgi:hypothetical protein